MNIMAPILEINADEAGKKLNLVRRYHSEILLIVFCGCIFYLFKMVIELKDDFNKYLQKDNIENTQKIVENTNVLKDIKMILLQNQDIQANLQEQLRNAKNQK